MWTRLVPRHKYPAFPARQTSLRNGLRGQRPEARKPVDPLGDTGSQPPISPAHPPLPTVLRSPQTSDCPVGRPRSGPQLGRRRSGVGSAGSRDPPLRVPPHSSSPKQEELWSPSSVLCHKACLPAPGVLRGRGTNLLITRLDTPLHTPTNPVTLRV